jgi:hypothetical protein
MSSSPTLWPSLRLRELESGTLGKFDRLQLSGKYDFRFSIGSD